jgi:hypothetical protein
MKKFTNYALGARGIRTEDGLVMLDPGDSVELDPKTIVGALPDLGKKGSAPVDNGDFDALNSKVAELNKQVETLEGEKAELTKQVETLTKPPAK